MVSRIVRTLAIRPGEGRLVGLLAALFATVEAGRGIGEIAVDTLLLSRFGAQALPYLFIALGLVSMVAMLGYGASLGRLPRRAFLVGLIAGLASLLAVLRLAVLLVSDVVPLLWLTIYGAGAILVTTSWIVGGATLDARQGKRLFPILTSAAIVGGFIGTLAAGPLARGIGTENLVLVDAALLAVAAALVAAIGRHMPAQPREPSAGRSIAGDLAAGFDYVRRMPLLRLVAVAYLVFAVLLFAVTFPFLQLFSTTFQDEADLASALGLLSAAVTAVSFIVSLGLANRFYARFGVASAALILPLVYLAGFGLWLVQFSLVTAVVFRFTQQVTQRGFSNAAWSAFYNVVPVERRAHALAFIDGVPGQLGIAVSGILLLAGSLLAPAQVFLVGALAAALLTWIVVRIRSIYGRSLVATLRAGLAEQVLEGGPGLSALAIDPTVHADLRAGLSDHDPGVRRLAAETLGRVGAVDATEALEPLLADADRHVRLAAIRALGTLTPTDVQPDWLDRAAGSEVTDPAIRAELALVRARGGHADGAVALAEELVRGPADDERIAGFELARRLGDRAPDTVVTAALAALGAESQEVRLAAANALNGRDGEIGRQLLDLVRSGSDEASAAAMIALDGHRDVRDELLDWAMQTVDRATAVRTHREALRTERLPEKHEPDETRAFLLSVLDERQRRLEERLLGALAVLGAPEASGLIRRCLRAPDPQTRAQAVEALDTIGDRRLGRAIVSLIESTPPSNAASHVEVLRRLIDDPDPWVRALALRCLSEDLDAERRAIDRRVATDPDGVVRSIGPQPLPAVPTAGEPRGMPDTPDAPGARPMTETRPTLGELDRMLLLRRVPLFGQLGPEDLQRIAAAATERAYPAGEVIVREGDLGDELVVIVDGGVRVVREDASGTRLLRTIGAGDHIGELAVLRERPRAATVIAEEPGVRGLVIAGASLRAILRERPQAAMAMLATLADRISEQ